MSCLLKAEHISFTYPSASSPVLRDVSLSISSGEIVALLGPNGSGKSTLIRALLGQFSSAGSIEWESKAVSKWKRRDLARVVAYLPQSPLWEPQQTVLEVLRQGRVPYLGAFGVESAHDIQVVDEVTIRLDLKEIIYRRLDEISGGQRQRVFLGRCLAQEPRAMLLDEPNTFLDLYHQVELCQLLRTFARQQSLAVFMASHDLNLAAGFADRLLLLHEGKIVAAGSGDEVLRPEILSDVYGVRMQRLNADPDRPIVFPVID